MATMSLFLEAVEAAGGRVNQIETAKGVFLEVRAPVGRVWVASEARVFAMWVTSKPGRDLTRMWSRHVGRIEMGTRPLLPSEKRA